MKTINIIALCVLLATPFYAGEKKKMNNKEQLKAAEKAYSKAGVEAANKDFKNGVYQIKVYGMMPPNKYYYDYLKEQFNVSRKGVAGCMVNRKIIKNVAGYNKVMMNLLKDKYKKDIFIEAKAYSEFKNIESNSGKKLSLKDQKEFIKKYVEDKLKKEKK